MQADKVVRKAREGLFATEQCVEQRVAVDEALIAKLVERVGKGAYRMGVGVVVR